MEGLIILACERLARTDLKNKKVYDNLAYQVIEKRFPCPPKRGSKP